MQTQLFNEIQSKINSDFEITKTSATDMKVGSVPSTTMNYQQFQDEIRQLISYTKNEQFVDGNYFSFFIFGDTGVGKCLAKGTQVLMSDGNIKLVEEIKPGDNVMGPDSKSRKVLSTTSGREMMYDIIPKKGESYRVNESHILSLKITKGSRVSGYEDGDVVNISVLDYLSKKNNFKHCAKGYRVPVEFKEKETPAELPPYFLGLWLGDGDSRWPTVTNIDEEVISYLKDFSYSIGAKIYEDKNENRTTRYRITYGREGKRENKVKDLLHHFDLIQNKHIPFIYKTNSRTKRLELLAGLIDSDGYYFHGGFNITQKRKELTDDIVYLARSLGFGVSVKEKTSSAHKNHKDKYFSVYISGDCSVIPTKIKRKKSPERKQKKDVLSTGIKVKKYKEDEYFGFSLEGEDRRFLLGDFTVTHNTQIIEQIAKDEECVYHKLEIQKVPIEILQGFPYLTEVKTETGQMKVAKLAPSTILPPSADNRTWVLHLDEFNKADADKMAAVMNLVLTGEIGGSADYDEEKGKSVKYKLPRKTVIIGSGNTKEQKNVENLNVVSGMDTATSERWHRTGYLPYNAESWIQSFALNEYDFFGKKLDTRVPGIIINFVLDKVLENGNQADPFLIPIIAGSEEGMESERTTSPRAWTLIADMMYVQMYNDFNASKKLQEEYKDNEDPFKTFAKDPKNQINYLKKQVFEFGLKGSEIVADIISRYIYFAENRVLPSNILYEYKEHRDKVKKLANKKGAILYLFLGIAYFINDTDEEFSNKELKSYCVNVSTFIEDCNIPSEDAVAFIQTLKRSKNKNAENFNEFMISISERYKNAYGGYYHTSIHELK